MDTTTIIINVALAVALVIGLVTAMVTIPNLDRLNAMRRSRRVAIARQPRTRYEPGSLQRAA